MSLTPRLDKLDKNYIINGAMDFWQRGTGLTNNVTGADSSSILYKAADRFVSFVARNGADIGMTFTKVTDAPAGTGLKYSLRATSNYNTSLGATSAGLIPFYQRIEGTMVKDMEESQSIYVSGWVKCSIAATISVCLDKANSTGTIDEQAYVFDISALANTWTFFNKKIDLPAQEIHKNTGTAFSLIVGAIFGSSNAYAPTSLLNQWNIEGTPPLNSTSATNWAATSGNWIQLTGLKLSDQPHSEFSSAGANYAEELLLCRRYFEKSYAVDVTPGTVTTAGKFSVHSVSANRPYLSIPFKAEKRAIPAITIYNSATGAVGTLRTEAGTDASAGVDSANRGTNQFDVYQASVFNAQGAYGHWTADAEI